MAKSDFLCKSCEHYLLCQHADKTITSCSQYIELVRCKDCKNYNGHRFCNYLAETMLDGDFCSYGERKDNETD